MVDVPEARACLRAAYQPADDDRKPLKKSHSLKAAFKRIEYEADELKEAVSGRRPFSETVRKISERMK